MKTGNYFLGFVVLAAISLSAGYPAQEPLHAQYEAPPENGVNYQQNEEDDRAEHVQEMKQEDEPLIDIQSNCIRSVIVIAQTSGEKYADTDDSPYLHLTLTEGRGGGSAQFPDNPGDDMERNKEDTWEISIGSFGFSQCLTKSDISTVYLTPGGSDGWKIYWIRTMVVSGYGSQELTYNFLNRWLDADEHYSHRLIHLTLR